MIEEKKLLVVTILKIKITKSGVKRFYSIRKIQCLFFAFILSKNINQAKKII